jgi:hypothetical protein
VIREGTLAHAAGFQDRLVLFSERGIYSLRLLHREGAPPAQIDVLEEFENDPYAPPVVGARSIFFAHQRGDFCGIHESSPSEEAATVSSSDVAAHVPAYLRGSPVQLAVSTMEDVLCVLTDTQARYLYVFKFQDTAQGRVQSAWHRFDFGAAATVRGAAFIRNDLYLVIERSSEVVLERMRLRVRPKDSGANWACRLDRRVDENSGQFSKVFASGNTTITLPYKLDDGATVNVVTKSSPAIVTVSSTGSATGADARPVSTVVVAGNYESTDLYVGQTFRFEYEFTDPSLATQGTESTLTRVAGRLQLHEMAVYFFDTRTFDVVWSGRDGVDVSQSFSYNDAEVFRSPSVSGLDLQIASGVAKVSLATRSQESSIRLRSDSPLPCSFSRCDFEASATEL